jgi:hypothetical protein
MATLLPQLDFMSLMERRICEERLARLHRTLTTESAEEGRRKRRRREMVAEEVERVMLQARSGDKLVVFGGNSRRRFMNDLYVLDVEFEGKPMLRWHPITQAADANGYVASSRHYRH